MSKGIMLKDKILPYSKTEFRAINVLLDENGVRKHGYGCKYDPESFWEDLGKIYFDTLLFSRGDYRLNFESLEKRIALTQARNILEVGSGFGRCMFYLVNKLPHIKKITGIEMSGTMLNKARYILKEFEHKKKVEFIQGNAKNLPFPWEYFDLTYTHACLTHIPPEQIEKVIFQICAVTKEWIIHFERMVFPYEHSSPHRWSHVIVPIYQKLGWKCWENLEINEEHKTTCTVFRRV